MLDKVPLSNKYLLDVLILDDSGYQTMYYTCNDNGQFFQVTFERGKTSEELVAESIDEMVDYFVWMAIWSYARQHELKHRRYFENNLRQTHEIMEWCYSFIDGRKIVQPHYDDEIHIILDLLHAYEAKCKEIRMLNHQPQEVIELCNYINEYKYADSPYGENSDTFDR